MDKALVGVEVVKNTLQDYLSNFNFVEFFSQSPRITKIYLVCVTVHSLLLSLVGIVDLFDKDSNLINETYSLLGLWLSITFFLFSYMGVMKENSIQIVFSVLASYLYTFLLWWYFIRYVESDDNDKDDRKNNKDQDNDELKELILAVSIISTLCSVSYIPLSYKLIKSFGWYKFNKFDFANTELFLIFEVYQTFLSSLFFCLTLQVCLSILIVGLTHGNDHHPRNKQFITDLVVSIFVTIISLITILFIRYFTRTEDRTHMLAALAVFILLNVVYSLTYLILRFDNDHYTRQPNTQISKYQFMTAVLVVNGSLIVVMYYTYRVILNFDLGLKQSAFTDKVADAKTTQIHPSQGRNNAKSLASAAAGRGGIPKNIPDDMQGFSECDHMLKRHKHSINADSHISGGYDSINEDSQTTGVRAESCESGSHFSHNSSVHTTMSSHFKESDFD